MPPRRGAPLANPPRTDHGVDTAACDGARPLFADDELPASRIEHGGHLLDGDLHLPRRRRGRRPARAERQVDGGRARG